MSHFQNKRALVELEKCKSNSGAKIQLQDLSEVDGWVMINMRLLTPEVWSGSYNAQMTTTLASCWRRVTSPRWQWGRAVLWSHAASSLAGLVFSSLSQTLSISVMRRFVHLKWYWENYYYSFKVSRLFQIKNLLVLHMNTSLLTQETPLEKIFLDGRIHSSCCKTIHYSDIFRLAVLHRWHTKVFW